MRTQGVGSGKRKRKRKRGRAPKSQADVYGVPAGMAHSTLGRRGRRAGAVGRAPLERDDAPPGREGKSLDWEICGSLKRNGVGNDVVDGKRGERECVRVCGKCVHLHPIEQQLSGPRASDWILPMLQRTCCRQ